MNRLSAIWSLSTKGCGINRCTYITFITIGIIYEYYEGVEKVWHNFTDKAAVEQHKAQLREALQDPNINVEDFEKYKIKAAIRIVFILFAEIIIIALTKGWFGALAGKGQE